MKKLKVLISIIVCIFCMVCLSSCIYKYLIQPVNERNEELPASLTTGKSLVEYARKVVEEDSGKEFNVGEVDMRLDSELKGAVEITLVEKKERKPQLVYVKFDTKSNKLLSFYYQGWQSKSDPGIINFQDWAIDYTEAIEISEKFFSQADGFRYDRVWMYTVDSHPSEDEDWEVWMVDLLDDQGEKRYYARIDPYTGDVLLHSISKLNHFDD